MHVRVEGRKGMSAEYIAIGTPPTAPREATCYDSTRRSCAGPQPTAAGLEKKHQTPCTVDEM